MSAHDDTSPASSAPAASLHDVLGEFRVMCEIGRGGMGVVYEAEQQSLRRTVALKVLPAHLTLSPDSVERFRREASTAARLKHASIVEIYAVGQDRGHHYFAMELIEGAPLDKVVATLKREAHETLDGAKVGAAVSSVAHRARTAAETSAADPPDEPRASSNSAWTRSYIETVCRIVAQIADALAHAHHAGVIHRDVKPSNIVVRGDGTAVLTDFGLARESGLPSLTQTGEFAGTPYYVSPEQARAQRILVDHRTDVYSLGVTLFELITLRRPFEGSTSQEVLGHIISKAAPLPRKLNPRVPRDLETICLTAIDKDPDRRYATAADLAADIRRFLAFHTVVARPVGTTTRALRWMRREPLKAGLVGLLAIGVPSLLGLAGYFVATRSEIARGREQLKRDQVETQLEIGYLEFGMNAGAKAVAAFEQALRLDPLNPEAVAGLVLTRTDGTQRLAVLDAYPDAERASSDLTRLRAGALRDLGRLAEAQDLEVRCGQPTTALAFFIIGNHEIRSGDASGYEAFEQARRNFGRAVRLSRVARAFYVFQWAYAAGESRDAQDVLQICEMLEGLWPDSKRAWYESGCALKRVDPQRALACFRRAIELDESYCPAYVGMGTVLSLTGDLVGAAAACRRAIELDPESGEAHNNLGIVLSDAGDLAGAIAEYRRAIELQPERSESHDNLALALAASGDVPEAVEEYRRTMELSPMAAAPHHNLGVLMSQAGDEAGAMAEFRRAIELDPMMPEPRHHLGYLLRATGDLPAAVAEFKRAIELDPDDAEQHYILGVAMREMGFPEEAAAEYRQAIELDPTYPLPHGGLGNLFIDAGDPPSAIAEYKRALEIDPGYSSAHESLVAALIASGNLQELVSEYRRLVELDPQSATAHNDLGIALKDTGDHQAAIVEYRRAIELDPISAWPHNNLGYSLDMSGDLAGAIAEYRQALELDPLLAKAHNNLLAALKQIGDLAAVRSELSRWTTVHADDPSAWNELAWFQVDPAGRAEQRDPAAALSAARRAVELSSGKEPNFLDTLAEALFATGDFAAAVETESKALDVLKESIEPNPALQASFNKSLARFREAAAAGP